MDLFKYDTGEAGSLCGEERCLTPIVKLREDIEDGTFIVDKALG